MLCNLCTNMLLLWETPQDVWGRGGMARGGDDLAHTHSTQDGRIAHRVTQRNFSFGDKEFGVTLPLFKCLPGNTRMTAIFRYTSVQVKLMTCRDS